ncbi:SMP-30/gluconolactonase/LRE family protein [Streptomyces sp. NPDC059373]
MSEHRRYRRFAGAGAVALAAALLVSAQAPGSVRAPAAAPPVTGPRIVAHFDLAAGQQPENIALEPDGAADLTFNAAHQVARVTPGGRVRILATLPTGGGATGIARARNGTLYVVYHAGTAALTGVWCLDRGGSLHRIAALPATGFPNGAALDERTGRLYVADSKAGTVWRVNIATGRVTAWAHANALTPNTGPTASGYGVNGVKLRHSAVWVSNTDKGTLLRIPVRRNGSAGRLQVRASGLGGIDDFTFVGRTGSVLAAIDAAGKLVLLTPRGTRTTVLTATDGLSNPTSVALRGTTLYVPSAAYLTAKDPNLLLARFRR